MLIFQDDNGLAIKFFIQKDIPQEIQAELCEAITSLGGRVEMKVPRQGFILVQPNSPEEERLRQCWIMPERPNRFLVPYTYVEACKISGMLLKQIFLEKDNKSIRMHIHASIANPNARNLLRSRIMHSGGYPDAPMRDSRVILADPNTDVFKHLVKTYQGKSGKHIESYLWVKKCIESGIVAYTPVVYKNPGGRRPGEERRQFTDEDENNLCQWIAEKIPYKETGGRTGNRLYQQLCEQIEPEYQWVTRHTWQSWRERYKKHAHRLDEKIGQIVAENRPVQGEQGQYGYVRQPEQKSKRPRRKRAKTEDRAMYDEESTHHTTEDLAQLSAIQVSEIPLIEPNFELGAPTQPSPFQNIQALPNFPPLPSHESLSLPPEAGNAPTSSSPDEEEMDDNEESQWVVRVGNDPPPTWAKRKADDNSGPSKRHNNSNSALSGMAPPIVANASEAQASTQINATAFVALANMHVIDQNLREIAKNYRFTLEEVQEFYDKCGEMGRTKHRFQLMRDLLAEKFSNDS